MTRRPRVNPLVPTRDVDYWLRNVHVATPDPEVIARLIELMDRADFGKQCPRDMTPAQLQRWVRSIRLQTQRYTLWRHHQNYAEFAWVMGPH